MRAYTTQLTRIWTGYFALVVLSSIVVYLTLSFSAWSLLANVLTPASVALLFVGEHLLRYRLHPEFERTRMVDAVRAFYGSSSADSSAGTMPSLSVVQAVPSRRRKVAPALSSPPKASEPSTSPSTNHLKPTGTS